MDFDDDESTGMRELADEVTKKCGKNYGFVIIVFPFGEGSRDAHYISNAERESIIPVLRQKADNLEKTNEERVLSGVIDSAIN